MKLKMFVKYSGRVSPFIKCFSTRNVIKLRERYTFEDVFPDTSMKEITDLLNGTPQTVYAGFDPTADSLHVGNLLVLMNLLHWQRGGHNAIALIGGATAKIGDPSGKNVEREVLSNDFINSNIEGIRNNIETVFENHKRHLFSQSEQMTPIKILNNESWYNKMSAVELISKAGRHLRMGTLLSRSSVQSRLSSQVGMSFTEFSYQLFQAYDWLYLLEKYRCRFQVGGNDQMGNIMSGHELISKVVGTQVFGLTVPLVTTEMGDKLGKSAGNAVWLSAKKTSPFTFYQFWIRIPDSTVEKMLLLFTFDALGSIKEVMKRHEKNPELRLPQKRLAEQVTILVHGEEGLKTAKHATKALYEGSVAALGQLRAEDILQIFQGATVVELLPQAGQSVLDVALKAGCFSTNHDALRIISAGGFYINQQRVTNPAEVLNINVHILENNVSLLRVGKKNYYIVKWLR